MKGACSGAVIEELVEWAEAHSPVMSALRGAIQVKTEVGEESSGSLTVCSSASKSLPA